MKKNTDLKSLMIQQDAYCYSCVFPRATLDLHHALIHDQKRYHDILTVEENCVLVCRDCHPFTNGHEFRVKVLLDKVEILGLDRMRGWWDSLPEKLKMTNVWIGEELK